MDDDTPPLTLSGYAVHHLLGSGATGEVWLAREERSGDLVALKRLRDPGDAAGRERLTREAGLLAAFRHAHVIRLRSVETDEAGAPVLVLDHAAGGSLAALLARRGRLDPGEVVTVAAPLAEALAAAHAAGLVHADVTPANVLFDAAGRPLLADLGVGRLVGERPGVVESTADYLDPAVAAGGQPTPATDVHALAAVCHHMLAGAPPYAGSSLVQVLRAAAAGERTPLRTLAPGAPPALLELVEQAMEPEPGARPGAAALAASLLAAVPAQPVRLRGGAPPVQSPEEGARGAGAEGTGAEGPGPRWWSRRRRDAAGPGGAAGADRVPDEQQPGATAGAAGWAGAAVARAGIGPASTAPRPTHAVPVRLAAVDPLDEDPEDEACSAPWVRARRVAVAVGAVVVLVGAVALAGLRDAPPADVPLAVAAPAVGAPVASAGAPTGGPVEEGRVPGEGPGEAVDLAPADDALPDAAAGTTAVGGAGGDPATGRARPVEARGALAAASESAAGAATGGQDHWRAVVEELDARRAEAFARADPAVLDQVYVAGSEGLTSDRAVVDALTTGGLTIRGARHEVRDVTVLQEGPGRVRVRVVDVLPEHEVVDAAGVVVEQRAASAAAGVEMELVDTGGAWRIATVTRS